MKKFLKKVAWISGGIIALLVIIGFLLPAKQAVDLDITMEAPLHDVFEQVNDLHNWKSWSPWEVTGSGKQLSYSNPPSGASAFMHWEHPQIKSDQGRVILTEVDNYTRIVTQFEENNHIEQTIVFRFTNYDDKVEVNMETDRDFGWTPWNKYAGLFWKSQTKKAFRQALQAMRSKVEAR